MKIIVGCVLRGLAVCLYGYLGAIMFVHVENSAINQTPSNDPNVTATRSALDELRSNYRLPQNISDTELKSLAEAIITITRTPPDPKQWTENDGLQLVFETLTTIGYGSTPPATQTGRILIIFYALVGIPLYLYFLQIIGEAINKAINKVIWLVENKCLKVKEPKSVEFKCLVGFATSLSIYIFSMAFLMSVLQGQSYTDSVYALFITLTTVGFGDFVVGGDKMPIVVVGLCLMSGLFDAVVCYMEKKAEERRNREGKKCCCFGKHTGAVKEVQNNRKQEGQEDNGTTIDLDNV